jgi:hypothetical protein
MCQKFHPFLFAEPEVKKLQFIKRKMLKKGKNDMKKKTNNNNLRKVCFRALFVSFIHIKGPRSLRRRWGRPVIKRRK